MKHTLLYICPNGYKYGIKALMKQRVFCLLICLFVSRGMTMHCIRELPILPETLPFKVLLTFTIDMCTSCFSNWSFKHASHCLHCQMKLHIVHMNWYLPDSSSDWTTVWKRVFHPVPHLNLMPPFQWEGLSPSLLLHFYQMCFAHWNIISEEGTCDHFFCQSKGMSAVSNSNSLIDQKTKQNTLTVTRMVSGHLYVRTVESYIFKPLNRFFYKPERVRKYFLEVIT